MTYDGTSEVLTLNPENWNTVGYNFQRSDVYYGFTRLEYISSYRFPILDGGGGQFIIDAYEDNGIEAEVSVLVEKRNPQTWDYDTIINGVLDIKPDRFVIDKYNRFVECNIIDSSKQNKFASRDEINYNLFSLVSSDNVTMQDFTTPYATIEYLPIDIIQTASFNGSISDTGTLTTVGNDQTIAFTGGDILTNEIGDGITVENGVTAKKIYENTGSTEKTIKVDDIEYDSDIDCTFTANSTYSSDFARVYTRLAVRDSGDVLLDYVWIDYYMETQVYYLFPETPPKQIVLSHDQDDISVYYKNVTGWLLGLSFDTVSPNNVFLDVPAGGYIELESRVYEVTNIGVGDLEMTYDVSFDLTSITLTEISEGQTETDVNGMFVHEAFTRLIQLMTSEIYPSRTFKSELTGKSDSEFINESTAGELAYDFITSGKLIRQYPNAPLNVSFRNLFKTFDGLYNLGLAYDSTNQRYFLDNKSRFYNTNLLFDLGEVKSLKITPYSKAYFSKILSGKAGKIEYENAQGANEYCVETEHSLSIPVKETLDIRTPYNTDSVGQELARREQYDENSSKDTRQDENIYITRTDGSQTVQNGVTVTGYAGIENMYNIAFSPRECVLRWTNWIISGLWRSTTKIINFVSSQKNLNHAYTNEDGNSVNEQDNIEEYEMMSAIIRPEIDEFESPITDDMVLELKQDPHGIIIYSYFGEDRAVFLDSVDSQDFPGLAKWKGISVDYDEVVTGYVLFENGNEVLFENNNNLMWN